jgi:hypothetical protein
VDQLSGSRSGALNCVYDIFAATDREFSSIFPPGTNVAFIDEVLARHDRALLDAVFSRIWARPIRKAAAHGIHGTLYYELAGKKPFFPTRRDEEAVNPDGSLLRSPRKNRARAGRSRATRRARPGESRSGA